MPRITRRSKPCMKETISTKLASSAFGWSSKNWSGYAIKKPSGSITGISGVWIVPHVSSSKSSTYSSIWIGIDGFNNASLIQTGTEQDYVNGQAQYYAWWEILPDAETRIPYPVAPGDRMQGTIFRIVTGHWKISLTNRTQGWTYTTIQAYDGPQSSAEWILEAPSVNGQIAKLANYRSMVFNHVKLNGKNPQLVSTNGGYMVQRGKHVSTPSVPDSERDGFRVRYGSARPVPPHSGTTSMNAKRRPSSPLMATSYRAKKIVQKKSDYPQS